MTTLTSPHDLLAAVPFLIGYHPTSSLVIVSLKDDAIGMAMRVDYPSSESISDDLYDSLIFHLVRERAEGALVVAYVPDDRSDGEEVLENIESAMVRASIPLRESLLIVNGRWRSVICTDSDCCPLEGRVLPELTTSRVAVEQVAQGRPMPFADVDGLTDSIAPLPLSTDLDFLATIHSYCIDPDAVVIQTAQRASAIAVIDLVARFVDGSIGTDFESDQELSARVIAGVGDIQVRDFALGSHDETSIDFYWSMWRYLMRIAPAGFVAPIASLFAALSYERGEGALAQRALDRALSDDPSYSLASLLRRVFSAGWPPESFAAMRKDLHPKVCAGIFAD
ncbi:MAG: DUF4192 domain-containing protein [Candidatus Nanopelagicaceae bacterium]|nr:DUF4192 domain-containing protein [Candidatus Nanopelagicaceae bacterium]